MAYKNISPMSNMIHQAIPDQQKMLFFEKNPPMPNDFQKVVGTGYQSDAGRFEPAYMKPMNLQDNGQYSSANQLSENSFQSNFLNYQTAPDFNLWKNNQPPPPPTSWWGTVDKEKPAGYKNWSNPPARMPEENYYQNSMVEARRNREMDSKVNNANTYSLFSGNSWGNPVQAASITQEQSKPRLTQQSLWSGPGPSPLERLLEQQKSLREGGT
uniref:Uncharacterized protein n=1 Tax=Bracon brevicornis TaxID=1563983 RepID=A0A6V7I2H3_9HYME